MVPGDSGVEQTPAAASGLDSDSAEWLGVLADTGPRREAALARLHEMLLRIARGEARLGRVPLRRCCAATHSEVMAAGTADDHTGGCNAVHHFRTPTAGGRPAAGSGPATDADAD
jgi:hypothetical protein